METIVAQVLQNARVQLLIFLFLVMVFAAPVYMNWRVEQAIDRMASRLECGNKIRVSSTVITDEDVANVGKIH